MGLGNSIPEVSKAETLPTEDQREELEFRTKYYIRNKKEYNTLRYNCHLYPTKYKQEMKVIKKRYKEKLQECIDSFYGDPTITKQDHIDYLHGIITARILRGYDGPKNMSTMRKEALDNIRRYKNKRAKAQRLYKDNPYKKNIFESSNSEGIKNTLNGLNYEMEGEEVKYE